MERSKKYKRVRQLKSCPNPLFLKWLIAWKDEAFEKGWKTHHTYSKAIKSLSKYPLVLKTGKEAKLLEFFGDKICDMLDKKLRQELGDDPTTDASSNQNSSVYFDVACSQESNQIISSDDDEDESRTRLKEKKARKDKNGKFGYCPAPRSGPYALLLALLDKHSNDMLSVTKKTLIEAAQPLCDTSFTRPLPGSYYTAWSSMASLTKKNIIIREGHPPRFKLSDDGFDLAGALKKTMRSDESNSNQLAASQAEVCILDNDTEIICDDSGSEKSSPVYIEAGSYEVVMLVDVAETNSSTGYGPNNSKSALIPELRKNGVNFEVRKLNVGDFTWIAKEKVTPLPGCLQINTPKELVLDVIVERKRMDDLASSIKDGRFHEQKNRLEASRLKKVIYLVENYKGFSSLPYSSLQQAVANTQVISEFLIRWVNDSKDSVAYLTLITRHLTKLYEDKDLYRIKPGNQDATKTLTSHFVSFDDFNSMSVKNKVMSVSNMFIRMLMKISGVSLEKATAIVFEFPTLTHLLKKYGVCETDKERELLLANISCSKRKIGPAISRTIYMLYCKNSTS